ncbi:hypothetical protein GLOIN_2v1669728 [Rhizophagus clarus]|uniref:Uncharacterized protein n=1 Tax=Rhizophagus clarus TaxID=94130 RepID=A0A8H3LZV2_9GLOM|nr:hypothetical protein GLOIN_2v1669728 [Rhizophagus clarus]
MNPSDTNNVTSAPQQITETNSYHPTVFYHYLPNDFYYYHINCKEISYNTIAFLLNKFLNNNIQNNEYEHIFFYHQRHDNRFYKIICEIIDPSSITNYLNQNIHGHVIGQNANQEKLCFSGDQKENIESQLTQYLSQYLLN